MMIRLTPQKVFMLVWFTSLVIPYVADEHPMLFPVKSETLFLVCFNITVFFGFGLLFRSLGIRGGEDKVRNALSEIFFPRFKKRIHFLFNAWAVSYLINIIGSGGFPLLWVVQGDPRTYVDFGLPTLGGLSNMLRAFVLSACYIIYKCDNSSFQSKRKYLLAAFLLILTTFLLETGRGNGVVLMLHPVALYILMNRFSLKKVAASAMLFIAFVGFLGLIQHVRYMGNADYSESVEKYIENSGFDNLGEIEALLVPAVMYMAMPVINTDLNVKISEFIKFEPYYVLQGLLPTVIRDAVFTKGDYGELVNEANNASSYYVPFLRDFGVIGAVLGTSILLAIVSYWYARAMQGNAFYILSYPPFFMSVTLSFFYLFFSSLVVILYPLVTLWALKGCIKTNSSTHRPRSLHRV